MNDTTSAAVRRRHGSGRGVIVTATFDRSMAVVLSALDEARGAAVDPSAEGPGDDDVAALLATVRLEMSVAHASRSVERANDIATVEAALDGVADAALIWLDDVVIQRRLALMRVRDRAAAVTCRVDAAASELRQVAKAVRSDEYADLESARRSALKAVRAGRATLEDAMTSVRHAG